MGYETYYSLTVDPYKHKPFTNEEKAVLESEIDLLNVFTGELAYGYDTEIIRWYDHDDDMCRLSAKFPDVLFELHGDGENSEDFWITYYLNGQMQYCQGEITYAPFSEYGFTPIRDLDLDAPYSYQRTPSPPRTPPPPPTDINAVALL